MLGRNKEAGRRRLRAFSESMADLVNVTRRKRVMVFCQPKLSLPAIALVMAVFAACATAQTYPAKAIKLITSGAPGSIPDTVARPLAEQMARELHQPVIVENRPGAGGILAMNTLVKAR